MIFLEKNQLQAIFGHVPTENPKLSQACYEILLTHLLAHNHEALYQTICTVRSLCSLSLLIGF